jgi:chromosome segregation ATPase
MISLTSAFMLLAVSAADAQRGQLYRWVDENGTVHYSQQPPPDLKSAHSRMNNGRREDFDRELSGEELAAQQAAEEESEEMAELMTSERDRLRRTYSQPSDITRARDERLQGLESTLESTQATLRLQRNQLRQMVNQAADRIRRGARVSDDQIANVNRLRSAISDTEAYIASKHEEREEILLEFENELSLYQALVQRRQSERDGG